MAEPVKAPWHIWVVGMIALLWSAGSAFDYVMTQTRNADYMAQFTPEQLAFFYSFPGWMVAAWAIGVWSAVLGAVLLLLRSRWAVSVLWLALVSAVITAIFMFALAKPSLIEIVGPIGAAFSALIIVVAALLVWYAYRMRARGVLS